MAQAAHALGLATRSIFRCCMRAQTCRALPVRIAPTPSPETREATRVESHVCVRALDARGPRAAHHRRRHCGRRLLGCKNRETNTSRTPGAAHSAAALFYFRASRAAAGTPFSSIHVIRIHGFRGGKRWSKTDVAQRDAQQEDAEYRDALFLPGLLLRLIFLSFSVLPHSQYTLRLFFHPLSLFSLLMTI